MDYDNVAYVDTTDINRLSNRTDLPCEGTGLRMIITVETIY